MQRKQKARLVKSLRYSIKRTLAQCNEWRHDTSMINMFKKDARDLQKAIDYLKADRLYMASKTILYMDTAAGEFISCYVMRWAFDVRYKL